MNNYCNVTAEIPIQQLVFRVIFVGEVNINRLRMMDNLRLNEQLLRSEAARLLRRCIVRKNCSERLMLHFVALMLQMERPSALNILQETRKEASELTRENDGLKTECDSAQV